MAEKNKFRKVLQFNLESQEELVEFEMVLNKLAMKNCMKDMKMKSIPEAIKSILEEIAKD